MLGLSSDNLNKTTSNPDDPIENWMYGIPTPYGVGTIRYLPSIIHLYYIEVKFRDNLAPPPCRHSVSTGLKYAKSIILS